MQIARRQVELCELKVAGDAAGTFTGYGSTFGGVDSYGDQINPGAFAADLKAWRAKGKWPKMLLQHGGWGIGSEDMLPVGQWTDMQENSRGLKVTGRLLAMNTDRGQMVYEGLKAGELDSLSIGYEPKKWMSADGEDGGPTRILTEIKLWEVSIVTFPANDEALISSIKQLTPEQWRDLEALLRDAKGLSRADAVKAISGFKEWSQREAVKPMRETRDEISPDVDENAKALLQSLAHLTDKTWAQIF